MKKIFIVFAVFFILSAVYHLSAVFLRINESPVWRNLLFTAINLFTAYGLLKRPSWFIYLFAVLVIQQFYSHGLDLLNRWNLHHKIDWISLVVLVIMPVIFAFLLADKTGTYK